MAEQVETPVKPNPLVGAIESLGHGATRSIAELGGIASLGMDVSRWAIRPPYRVVNLFFQFDFVGVGSIFIVCLTAVFTGMVFAHQSARAFELFKAESLVGPTVALTITRELSPVFTALMVTM